MSLLYAHKTLVALLATIVLLAIAHGIEIVSVLPLYLTRHFRVDETLVGFATSAYLLTDTLLVRTPAGWLADRWSRKGALLLGLGLSAGAAGLMLWVDEPLDFVPINVVNGLGAGMVWPAIYAMVADMYDRKQRGLVLGLVNMVMLGGIVAGGPIVGNVLLGLLGYPAEAAFSRALALCLVFVLVALGLVAVFVRDLPHAARVPEASAGRVEWARSGEFLMLLGMGFLTTLGLGLIVPVVTLYGADVLQLAPPIFALVLLPPALTAALALLPAGRWADRSGRDLPLALGIGILGAAFLGAPVTTEPVLVSLGGMVAGLGYALMVPAWNALVMDWVPANARGVFMGMVATVQGAGLALGPALGGVLWNRFGPYAPFTTAGLLFALALAVVAVRWRRAPRVRAVARREQET